MTSDLEMELENTDSSKPDKEVSIIRTYHILRDLNYECKYYHGASGFVRKMVRNKILRKKY